jgi:translation initiation factor 5B
MIRQPIIVVMGHVDHGKTTLLDKIRNTAIAAKEAGQITQHIAASEVPIDAINKICGPALKNSSAKITIPGLLFIDTPGHEAFTNLRRRGGNVADIAIVVVDVSQGFEPQTIEAIEILKEYKTPFVVAANKVDLITGWHSTKSSSIVESIKQQAQYVSAELDNRIYKVVGSLSELGFSSERFDRIKDFQKELAIVPISAKTGEGIAELLMVVTGLAQRFLEMELNIEVKGPGRGSILEKHEITGLGTTIDVILYDGTLHVNDSIAFATQNGIARAKVKALLKPKPLHEIRESTSNFLYVDEVNAASGVKISGTGLDDAMPGSLVIQTTDPNYESQIAQEIQDVFMGDGSGVVLKADSIGSIEAISKLLKSDGFKIAKKAIGDVTKRDVIDMFTMSAADPTSAAILAFNVSIDADAQEASQASNVTILQNNVIYGLIDDYKKFVERRQHDVKQKVESAIMFPGMVEVVPNACFRASHPAIFGISVLSGRVKPGYLMMSDNGIVIGRIKEMQNDKAPLDSAKKGDSVAVSMDEPTFGRQVRDGQIMYTRVTDSDEKLLKGEFANLISDEEKDLLARINEIKKSAKLK